MQFYCGGEASHGCSTNGRESRRVLCRVVPGIEVGRHRFVVPFSAVPEVHYGCIFREVVVVVGRNSLNGLRHDAVCQHVADDRLGATVSCGYGVSSHVTHYPCDVRGDEAVVVRYGQHVPEEATSSTAMEVDVYLQAGEPKRVTGGLLMVLQRNQRSTLLSKRPFCLCQVQGGNVYCGKYSVSCST
jgi:hypothetical protein